MAHKIYDEEIYFGKETAWSQVADFLMEPGEKLQLRKLMVSDQGNPGQIFFRRAGPDGVDPTQGFTRPEAVEFNQNVGHIAWFGHNGEDFGNRVAQIHCRYRGTNEGSLHFTTAGVERLSITETGYLDVSGMVDDNESIKVVVNGRKGRIAITWES